MKRVTGIGGIFFKAKDPVALGAWYKKHLGIDVQDWGGAAFRWTDEAGNPTSGTTIWSVGSAAGDQFAPSTSSFMINYRVADLTACWRLCAPRAATFSRRPTTPSTASSAGSWTRKATRSSSGNLPKGQ